MQMFLSKLRARHSFPILKSCIVSKRKCLYLIEPKNVFAFRWSIFFEQLKKKRKCSVLMVAWLLTDFLVVVIKFCFSTTPYKILDYRLTRLLYLIKHWFS